jgi:hypothetical protein
MTRRGLAFLAAFVAVAMASQSARAVSLYLEDFAYPTPGAGGPLVDVGWNGTDSVTSPSTGNVGVFDTFHWWYNETTAASMATPSGMTYTTENPPIPVSTSGLTISWAHRLENQYTDTWGEATGTGSGVDGRPAVLIGGQWYASATPVNTGNIESATFVTNSLAFDAAAANWVLVNDVDGTGGVTFGPAPGSALSGNITGVGLISTFYQFQTVNYDFLEVTAIPEPVSAELFGCSMFGLVAYRRRQSR